MSDIYVSGLLLQTHFATSHTDFLHPLNCDPLQIQNIKSKQPCGGFAIRWDCYRWSLWLHKHLLWLHTHASDDHLLSISTSRTLSLELHGSIRAMTVWSSQKLVWDSGHPNIRRKKVPLHLSWPMALLWAYAVCLILLFLCHSAKETWLWMLLNTHYIRG